MIDITTETLVPLAEVPALIPPGRRGKPVHFSAIFRWVAKGCRGVRLEAVQVGGRRMTSREALSRFFGRLSEQSGLVDPAAASVRSPAAKRRSHAAAEQRLDAAGVK